VSGLSFETYTEMERSGVSVEKLSPDTAASAAAPAGATGGAQAKK